MRTAWKDIRHAILGNSFEEIIRQANDQLEDDIQELISAFEMSKSDKSSINNELINKQSHSTDIPIFHERFDDDDLNTTAEIGNQIEVFGA